MNIKTKLILGIGMLAGMIILLVTLSVVNLQTLTATEPDSPAAMPALERALLWISITGGICILTGLILLYWLPRSISKPIKELKEGILEIANHNYEKRLDMSDNEEFREVADSFNRMAERLTEYRASTLSDILSAKKFIEAIVNSINDPIIGLNTEREVLFINDEALSILNMKRENVIRKSAEELSLKNDLLRRLIRELVTPSDQKEALKFMRIIRKVILRSLMSRSLIRRLKKGNLANWVMSFYLRISRNSKNWILPRLHLFQRSLMN